MQPFARAYLVLAMCINIGLRTEPGHQHQFNKAKQQQHHRLHHSHFFACVLKVKKVKRGRRDLNGDGSCSRDGTQHSYKQN